MTNIRTRIPKILFWDIETTPMLSYHFGLWDVSINRDWVMKKTSIICISYMWDHEGKVKRISILDKPRNYAKDPYDDKYVIKEFLKVLNQADAVVAHNGDRFDYKVLKARVIEHGLPDFKVRKIDTLKMAKNFAFAKGNRLKDLAEVLGVTLKAKSDAKWWIDIVEKSCPKAAELMGKYCDVDVVALREVYHKLLPYVETGIPALTRMMGVPHGVLCCNKCGSINYRKHNLYYKMAHAYQRYMCKDCNSTFLGTHPIKED